MAKGKSTWKYNKLLTARRNYFDTGGGINWGNPFKSGAAGGGFAGAMNSGALSGAATAVSGMIGSAIGGGLESGAGNAISGLANVASAIPGPWGAIAGAGLKVIGGLTNAIFGSKLNKENIAAVESATNKVNSAVSNAANFDTLTNTMGSAADVANFSNSYIGKDGWFSNKAKNKAITLRKEAEAANKRQSLAFLSNAEDIQADTLRNLEANYAAFGGPMDFGGGAIGYDFMNQYLGIKELAALGKEASLGSLPNSFADGGGIHIKKANRGKFTEYCGGKVTSECIARGKRSSSPAVRKRATFAANARKWKHAFGGDLLTHGANFDTGVTLIGNGGSHEENPLEGVPMGMDAEGVPNLVEEGEVIFNDYVFSNRLKVPEEVRKKYKLRGTKPLTFADAAKQMSKESEERPNDPISKAGLEDNMMKLMIEQEQLKAKKGKKLRGKRFDIGGSITDYAIRLGGQYPGLDQSVIDQLALANMKWDGQPLDLNTSFDFNSNLEPNTIKTETNFGVIETPTIGAHPIYSWDKPISYRTKPIIRESLITESEDKAPTWMRYVPAYASGIMSVTDALGLTNKPDYSEADMVLDAARDAGTYSPVDFTPIGNYLAYTPFDREFYINQMNAQSGATRRAIMQNAGLNRGAGMATLLASDYNTQGQLGQLARQAEEYNLAQRQKAEEFNRATNMFNTESALKADMANQEALFKSRDSYFRGVLSAAELRQRERQQSAAARSANLSNFINSLGDIGRENFARNMIISDPSKYYSIDADGYVTYKNGFDNLSEADKRQVRGHAAEHGGTSFARGGLLTIRKRRK